MEATNNEPLNNTEEATEPLTNTRREYMRKYMKERYEKDGDRARAYSKSLKTKAKHNITTEEFNVYGIYLADVFKIKQLKAKLPNEVWSKCLSELQTIAV